MYICNANTIWRVPYEVSTGLLSIPDSISSGSITRLMGRINAITSEAKEYMMSDLLMGDTFHAYTENDST